MRLAPPTKYQGCSRSGDGTDLPSTSWPNTEVHPHITGEQAVGVNFSFVLTHILDHTDKRNDARGRKTCDRHAMGRERPKSKRRQNAVMESQCPICRNATIDETRSSRGGGKMRWALPTVHTPQHRRRRLDQATGVIRECPFLIF